MHQNKIHKVSIKCNGRKKLSNQKVFNQELWLTLVTSNMLLSK